MSIPHDADQRKRLPQRRSHEVFAIEHEGMKFTAGIGRFPNGGLAELFVSTEKLGTLFDTVMRDAAILLSFALQYGADVEMIRRALVRNGDGSASGPIGALLDLVESRP
jgi:hypothetical protein